MLKITSFVQNLGRGRLRNPSLCVAAILSGLLLAQLGIFRYAALILLAGVVIFSTLYAAVVLPRRNESIIGRLPGASRTYAAGAAVVSVGNVMIVSAFLNADRNFVFASSIVILAGLA